MFSAEMPFVTSWAPLVNLFLILVLAIIVGVVAWRVLSTIKDWTIPRQDAELKSHKTEIVEIRSELASHRGRLNEHGLRLNGHGVELKTLREKTDLLGLRVDGIGEEQARLRNEHDKNHPVQWGKKP